MFGQSSGGSAFGGFGQNNQNQGQQTGSLFGGGSTGGAFGANNNQSGSVFGQSGFGSNASTTTGGSMFGQPSQPQSGFGFGASAARPAFGAPAANTGSAFGSTGTTGGLFGNNANASTSTTTSPFGSSNAFGATNNSTSAFGQPSTSAGTGLFGNTANKPATGFGGFGAPTTTPASTGFGGSSFSGSSIAPVNQGTTINYEPFREKEPANNVTNVYQSITCMPAYQKFSFEELREQDYAQGRRYGNGTGTGAFGKSTGFGGSSFGASTTTNSFGMGAPQQPAQPAAGGMFGSTNQMGSGTSSFGGTSGGFNSGSGFGQSNNSTGMFGQKPTTSLFGANNTGTGTNTGTGLFGSTAATNSSPFGQSSTTPAFGQQNTGTNTGTSLFGQNNNTAAKPAFGFGGGSTTQPTGFGAPATNSFGSTPAANTGTSLFGQNSSTPAFGQPAANNATSSFGFGANNTTNNTAASSTPSFGFGNNAAANTGTQNKSLFGGFNNTSTASTTPSLFGQTQPAAQPKPLTLGGGFGSTTGQPAAGTGLFGNTQPTGQQTSLFGQSSTPSTGLFSNTQSNTTNNAFGQKPLFGQTQQTGTGLFGGSTANTGTLGGNNSGTSLFGGAAQPTTSLFGNTQNQSFGANTQQAPLQASIDQNPFGQNPLFNYGGAQAITSSPGPIATPVSASAQKKKPALLPTYRLSPRVTASPRLKAPPRSSGLSPAGPMPSLSSSRSMLFDGIADDAILSSDAFNTRNDVRRLVIDRKVSEADLLTGGLGTTAKIVGNEPDKRLTFTPKATSTPMHAAITSGPEQAPGANGHEAKRSFEPSPVPSTPAKPAPAATETTPASERKFNDQGYWCSPSAAKLEAMSLKELEKVADFKVGRKGYGQVEFNQPVDLTAFSSPHEIPGTVVLFTRKACNVYPEDKGKPPVGQGLNVNATITLERCWPTTNDTKEPITEADHPKVIQHVDRLRRIKDTKFITYIADTGTWVFNIDHFSIWGLVDDEDDESVDIDINAHRETHATRFEAAKAQPAADPFAFAPKLPVPAHVAPSPHGDYSPMKMDDPDEYSRESGPTGAQLLSGSGLRTRLPGGWHTDEYPVEDTPLQKRSKLPAKAPSFRRTDAPAAPVAPAPPAASLVPAPQDMQEPILPGDADDVDEDDVDEPKESMDIVPLERPVARNWLEQLSLSAYPHSALDAKTTEPVLSSKPAFAKPADEKFTWSDLDRELFGSSAFPSASTAKQQDALARKGVAMKFYATGAILTVGPRSVAVSKIADSSLLGPTDNFDVLKVNLDHYDSVFRDNDLPKVTPSEELSFKELHRFTLGSAFDKDRDTRARELAIYELASILFDDIELPELGAAVDAAVVADRFRKTQLSEFWERLVEQDMSRALKEASPDEQIFTLLSGHKIEDACLSAVRQKNFHLGTLLPLIGGDDNFRDDIKKQLKDWTAKQTLSQVSVPMRKVYELLAGNTSESDNTNEGSAFSEDIAPVICVSDGLDWKRAFGVRLWYECYEDDRIAAAVEKYEFAVSESPAVRAPVPWYGADNARATDVLFELLKVYAYADYPLESLAAPETVGPAPLDFRIVWQVLNIFLRVKGAKAGGRAGDQTTVAFAQQLENEGHWSYALFVLLHLDDDDVCFDQVQGVLNRHVAEISASEATKAYVVQVLRVPRAMVLDAQATAAHVAFDSVKEIEYLLEAKRWEAAHKVLFRNLGPEAVISEDLSDLYRLICGFEDVSGISSWKLGGQIFLDYMNVVVNAKSGDSAAWWPKKIRGLPILGTSVDDSVRRLESSLEQLKHEALSLEGSVALYEMAKLVGVDI
ncbi:nuclear protein 96-domain-containing protein [Dipodascopsis tothii]|uniref:nuclear protein 96-domain-containing protein n=1 Tax=Dipodascopsis tothii TaxID=44089 RepID=UPI0034CF36C4